MLFLNVIFEAPGPTDQIAYESSPASRTTQSSTRTLRCWPWRSAHEQGPSAKKRAGRKRKKTAGRKRNRFFQASDVLMPSACVWLDRQFRTVMSDDGLMPAMSGFMKNRLVVVAA